MAKVLNLCNRGTDTIYSGDVILFEGNLCMVCRKGDAYLIMSLSDGFIVKEYSNSLEIDMDESVLRICKSDKVLVTLQK